MACFVNFYLWGTQHGAFERPVQFLKENLAGISPKEGAWAQRGCFLYSTGFLTSFLCVSIPLCPQLPV